jgi:2,4-dienoyl-CoA reductase-like NADH-dependent reductase (Old Yellow Enzyme family)
MRNDASHVLGQPLTLPCGAIIKNRIAKAAMTEGLSSSDGLANEKHCRLYHTWANGGAGLVITGNVMVDKRFLERPGNVIVDNNEGENQLQQWAHAGTVNNTHLWMQISHPGRQCTRWVNQQPVAPSNTQLKLMAMFKTPRSLTTHEIESISDAYADVALAAKVAGFKGVQIHGAHGYLISQFLSPIINKRIDIFGGSLNNRARFLFDIIAKVRNAVGADFPVGLKLNSADFQKGGFSIEECLELIQLLNDTSIDLIELSGGTYEQPQLLGHQGERMQASVPERESTRLREAYFAKYAIQVNAVCTKPLMVTGGFKSKEAMTEALNHVDMIGVARPFCIMPNWPEQMLNGLIDKLPRPENQLTGKGIWGPTSKLRFIQAINIQGEVAWFYQQILHLAEGAKPNLDKSLFSAFICHTLREQHKAHQRMRFLKKTEHAHG